MWLSVLDKNTYSILSQLCISKEAGTVAIQIYTVFSKRSKDSYYRTTVVVSSVLRNRNICDVDILNAIYCLNELAVSSVEVERISDVDYQVAKLAV